jgi:uncharacterized protein
MKIDLTELLQKIGNEADVALEQRLDFSEDGLILVGPVKINLHLVNTGTSVLLNGRAEATVEQECSRCLKKFQASVVAKLAEEYSKTPPEPKGKKGKEVELMKDNTLDLKETIRQNLLLALPMKPLCRPDCSLPEDLS